MHFPKKIRQKFWEPFGCVPKDHGVDLGSQDGPLRNANSMHPVHCIGRKVTCAEILSLVDGRPSHRLRGQTVQSASARVSAT